MVICIPNAYRWESVAQLSDTDIIWDKHEAIFPLSIIGESALADQLARACVESASGSSANALQCIS